MIAAFFCRRVTRLDSRQRPRHIQWLDRFSSASFLTTKIDRFRRFLSAGHDMLLNLANPVLELQVDQDILDLVAYLIAYGTHLIGFRPGAFDQSENAISTE